MQRTFIISWDKLEKLLRSDSDAMMGKTETISKTSIGIDVVNGIKIDIIDPTKIPDESEKDLSDEQRAFLEMKIENMGLSTRSRNAFLKSNRHLEITNGRGIVKATYKQLMDMRNFGKDSMEELNILLIEHGFDPKLEKQK